MKRKRMILLIVSVLMIVASLGVVLALLIDVLEKEEPITYEFGEIKLEVTGDLMDDFIYPGENLVIEEFILSNSSTIDINVRIKFEFYVGDMDVEVDPNEYIESIDFNLNPSDEVWDEDDGFYYYMANDGRLLPENTILLFTELVLNGWVVNNKHENDLFRVKLIIQAKQADHATWQDLGDKFIN